MSLFLMVALLNEEKNLKLRSCVYLQVHYACYNIASKDISDYRCFDPSGAEVWGRARESGV